MGPIPWIMIPELFPTYMRARASGICTIFLWGANWAIGQFTPMLLNGLGGGGTYIFFGIMNIICFIGVALRATRLQEEWLKSQSNRKAGMSL